MKRSQEACHDSLPPQFHPLCDAIQKNEADKLREQLASLRPGVPVLQLAFRYAALLGDDSGMQALAQEIVRQGGSIPKDAAEYARQATASSGVGGHTLAAVYAREVLRNPALASQAPGNLRLEASADWTQYCSNDLVAPMCAFVVRNDARGLRQWIQQQHHRGTLTPEKRREALDQALHYAAALGDDQGIQTLLQEGAHVTPAMVEVARNPNPNLPAVGGHAFAAAYLEAVLHDNLSPYIPLDRLRFGLK